ncbi:MAG TPA: hypothetical protein EYP85_02440 [Armatimonadetes bacterium]|nr:hypothetical protein [Armatimonadota bacterium]
MPELPWFDCNVLFGRRTTPRPESNLTEEQLLEELAYAGIGEALVTHAWAKEYDPRLGNEKCAELCAEHPQLTPCYVLLPPYTNELPAGSALLDYLREGGARAGRLYPRLHNYGLNETWCGTLLSTLAEAGVPVLLDLDQTNWTEIDRLLRAHPTLNLILLRVGYRIDRWVYPLFERYAGLHLETAFYEAHGGLEMVTQRFGAERLIFGTGLPLYDPGGAMAPILYAAVPPEAKRKIAGDNLRRILWQG